jgi:hypothetical protein
VLRLQSDSNLARDSATACLWQANVNNQALMASSFQQAFAKMQVLGQDVSKMVDCSEVIPAPPILAASKAQAFFPPGLTHNDVEQACASTPFPNLPTAPGAREAVPSMYVVPLAYAAPQTDQELRSSVQDPATDGACQDDGTGCNAEFTKQPA